MCVRPWIKAADVCPLTSTGPCLLHLWQAATARPLKCSLTTSSSSTIISSALVKAPPPPPPTLPGLPSCHLPLRLFVGLRCLRMQIPPLSMWVIPLCAPRGDTNHSVVFNDSAWPCLWISGRTSKTRNIYCLFAARFNQRESLQREKSARSQSKASPQWSTAPLSHTVTVVKRKKKKN